MNSNRNYENNQHILRSTLEDLEDSLESLGREYSQVLARGNPDRLDEFMKKTLNTFYEDVVWAKRNRAISREKSQYFLEVYTTVADQIQDTKRELNVSKTTTTGALPQVHSGR